MAEFTFGELTPTGFLARAANVYGDRTAIIDGDVQFTYAQFHHRSLRLAGALAANGISPWDRVAALCVNSHVLLELHNGVPLAGAVLVPINIRLAVDEIVYILRHSGAKLLIATEELSAAATEAASASGVPMLLAGANGRYEKFLAAATPYAVPCQDERGLLAINYTSGTTGNPKGVMYHHRGAYLQALAMAFHARLTAESRYLWTLPMFHCNGWCFTWGVTAAGSTHVCLRAIDPTEIWRLIRDEAISHFSAAPTVLTMISSSPAAGPVMEAGRTIAVQTGGAPPSPTLLARMAGLRMDVTHLYGLTETFGPIGINDWHAEWDQLDRDHRAQLKARQGVGNVIAAALRVVDAHGADVPRDGRTIGEIVCRGNDLMLGYYRDDQATRAANLDGWFRTGDLGVMHPDGYVELRDRSKDIIISGGENIASVEVERVLDSHPAVLESAMVGQPDERWGEIPVAFVTLRPDCRAEAEELIDYVRDRIARFKAPRKVLFTELPKTSTGKIRKDLLRQHVRAPDSAAVPGSRETRRRQRRHL